MTKDTSEIVYLPHPRVRLIPSAIAVSLAMSIGSFFVAYYNVNGMRQPAGYAPASLFLVFACAFLFLFWMKFIRITLTENGVRLERLLPYAHEVAFARYSDIVTIEQGKMSLKLVLFDKDHVKLFSLPETIVRVAGEITPAAKAAVSEKAHGFLLEIYELRQEIAYRVEQVGVYRADRK